MSAELLRRAAELLREHAEGATAGTWRRAPEIDGMFAGRPTVVRTSAANMRIVSIGQTRPHHTRAEGNIAYIALMHPPVALALARWLDIEAEAIEVIGNSEAWVDVDAPMYALARAILREEQP